MTFRKLLALQDSILTILELDCTVSNFILLSKTHRAQTTFDILTSDMNRILFLTGQHCCTCSVENPSVIVSCPAVSSPAVSALAKRAVQALSIVHR